MDSVAVIFIMFTFLVPLVADQSLVDFIELIGWVLVPRLIIVASVVVSLRNLCIRLKHLFMNQFAGESVPEAHHVEPIDCCKQVALLLPDQEVILFS